jgi:MoaA/NifB/PqqE/SkfB family radical SAM enzyme
MSSFDMGNMLSMFARLGTRSVTITGGGEPLLYPAINETIAVAQKLGIQAGLVTNGTLLDDLAERPTWVRISFDDFRSADAVFVQAVERAVARLAGVDWAFSYVLSRKPNLANVKALLRVADENRFTHIRIVSDLLDVESVPDMAELKRHLVGSVGEPLVVYQGRKNFKTGRRQCLISLLKPVVDADGGVYPCCGVQYALDVPSMDYERSMYMGHWKEMPEIVASQAGFDGSRCARCYYDDYNAALGMMMTRVEHGVFV